MGRGATRLQFREEEEAMAKKRKQSANTAKKKRKVPKKRGPKKKKGTSRKASTRNSGLKKQYFSRIKQEYHDIDYADQLNEKDKAWLSAFMDEDLGANFTHEGKKVYKKKRDINASYGRNNARNRDQYANSKAAGKTVDISADQAYQYWEENYIDNNFEQKVFDEIEKSKDMKVLTLDEYYKFEDQLTEETKEFYQNLYKLK